MPSKYIISKEPLILEGFTISKVEYPEDGGILLYSDEWLYPYKGVPYEHKLQAISIPKRLIITALSTFAHFKLFTVAALLYCLPKKSRLRLIEHFLQHFFALSELSLKGNWLKQEYFMPFSRELAKASGLFLINLGINKDISRNISSIIAMIFEHDSAYRFRMIDILSETVQYNLLRDHVGVLRRLFITYYEREELPYVREKVKNLERLLMFMLKFKGFRTAFLKTIEVTDFSKLSYDVFDIYHTLYRSSYKYRGQFYSERIKTFKRISPKI